LDQRHFQSLGDAGWEKRIEMLTEDERQAIEEFVRSRV
jgi:hypothetical protein